tara:strand:+ start:133 stop:528 length:396 start_codon:yes stop_codon:yes gene_type:complete
MRVFNWNKKKNEEVIDDSEFESFDLDSGEEYLWHKGVILKTSEKSGFIIPGRIVEGLGDNISIGDLIEISDEETIIFPTSPEGTEYPDFAVILESNVTIQLNKNCAVIHVHLNGEKPRKKRFMKKTTANKK